MLHLRIDRAELTVTDEETGRAATAANPASHERLIFSDFDQAVKIISDLIKDALGKPRLLRPKVKVSLSFPMPGGVAPIERLMLTQIVEKAGAREVVLEL